jgi:hypothetical protein
MLGMMPDPKKIASVIITSESGEMKEGPKVEQDLSPALDASAEKILTAFEKKDKKMLASAMREMLTILDAEQEMSEGD